MRKVALCLFAILCSQGALAESIQSVGLSRLETKDLLLLYYDPLQTYLTPYVAQAYENSFNAQRRNFDWTPWDKPTVQLRDLSDDGQAVVRATPNNALFVDVAPISITFETFSPGERFFTLMNHELVHVATMDVYNDQDAWWRGFFHGKPLPSTDHPENHPLQLSRHAARQCSALVSRRQCRVHGNMDGRRDGARAGRLRRDGVPRHGAGRREILRSARPAIEKATRSTSRWAPTIISMARASSAIWR